MDAKIAELIDALCDECKSDATGCEFEDARAALEAAIEGMEKRNRELREGLQRLGKHGVNCLGGFRTKKCICGLEKLLEEK
jgi:hypothetical protein